MKQILLYSAIYDFTAADFIERINEVENEDITVRLNSPGGSVFAGWGMVSAIAEHKGKTTLKVDGNASSMAFFLSLFFDKVEALDVTSFMIHRATGYVENEEDQKLLNTINSILRSKLEQRIDSKLFKDVTGSSIKDIFEAEKRKDVWLTAKDAQKIGLVDKVTRLQPREIEAIRNNLVAFSEFSQGSENEIKSNLQGSKVIDLKGVTKTNNNLIKKNMTIAKFKEEHADIYAQILALGAENEKDRVQAWLAFSDIDIEEVTSGIKSDKLVSQKVIAEMSRKAISNLTIKELEAESPEVVEKEKETEPKAQDTKELDNFKAEVFAAAGINNEKS